MTEIRTTPLIALAVAFTLGSGAVAVGAPSARSRHVRATLIAETLSIQPGQPLSAGIRLEMDPEWHTYWVHPGDSGLPTRLTWKLPVGFTAGVIQWPYPEPISTPPLMSYGYHGSVLLPVAIQTAADMALGERTISVHAEWLECKEACVPGKADLDLTVPVRPESAQVDPAAARLFAEAREHLPRPAEGWEIQAVRAGSRIALAFRAPEIALQRAAYFPLKGLLIEAAAPQRLGRTAQGWLLELSPASSVAADSVTTLPGVLVVGGPEGTTAVQWDGAVVEVKALPAAIGVAPEVGGAAPLAWAIGLALVGGVLLNLMPCVLPVLSLKVLDFVRQAGQGGRSTWHHGLAFTAGVLTSFWLLAGVLLVLRGLGRGVGWGFQLQSPGFVAGLAGLFFILGLNLLGVFEVGSSLTAVGNLTVGRTGLISSFGGGALATAVATPCTAPFMGSALGFGLSQTAPIALGVFTALGLGMAAPYLLLSASPALLRFVPKPGRWMETFKQLMGFLLFGTVVFLLWLFGKLTGVDGLTWLLAALLVLGMGAWVWGRGAATVGGRRLAIVSAAGMVVLALSLGVAAARVAAPSSGGPVELGGLAWEEWSPARVEALRAQGRAVFVDFTAAWCLTCQVNERVALAHPRVIEAFRRGDVALLRADWTHHDARIAEALTRYGRQGVPVYVHYPAGGEGPRLLPEVITPTLVLEALASPASTGGGEG